MYHALYCVNSCVCVLADCTHERVVVLFSAFVHSLCVLANCTHILVCVGVFVYVRWCVNNTHSLRSCVANNMRVLSVCGFWLTCVTCLAGFTRRFPTFYHTTETIAAQIRAIDCGAVPMSVRSESCGPNCFIDIVDIGYPNVPNRAFYLFGEHARELISPETALVLVNALCSPERTAFVTRALSRTKFRIVPNGNPVSRQLIERTGDFCLRANEHGVDLNRNWDFHWSPDSVANTLVDQLNSGPSPFSEPQTILFRDSVVEFNPTVFATVHSGTRGMYMPWAFAESTEPVRNGEKMKQLLSEMDPKFCECPAGQAAAEVGYNSPGTCLDWVHAHTNSAYSFAFEIYTGIGQENLADRYQQQLRGESFAQLSVNVDQRDTCFEQFNPLTKETYDYVVNNWANALIELSVHAAQHSNVLN